MLYLGDLLPGGKGDDRPDSMFDPEQLARGIAVEMEHTGNPALAKEIAKDHLTEDPQYYVKLAAIHLDGAGLSTEGWAKLLTVAAALGLAAFFTARARKPRRTIKGADASWERAKVHEVSRSYQAAMEWLERVGSWPSDDPAIRRVTAAAERRTRRR